MIKAVSHSIFGVRIEEYFNAAKVVSRCRISGNGLRNRSQ